MSVIDQIELNLERARALQKQRMDAEEYKNKSLNNEISQIKHSMQQTPPQNASSLEYDQPSNYSPLKYDIRQLELKDHEQIDEQLNSFSDESLSDMDQDYPIQPIYQRSSNAQQQQQIPIQLPLKEKPKDKQVYKEVYKEQHQQQQRKSKESKKQSKSVNGKTEPITNLKNTQNPIKRQINLHIGTEPQEQVIEKENTNQSLYNPKQEHINLQQKVKEIKEKVGNDLVTKQKTMISCSKQIVNVGSLRDQAELKYFGRLLPCNECVFLLNKGMSSDYCSQHGKINQSRPVSKQVPKRFEKYL